MCSSFERLMILSNDGLVTHESRSTKRLVILKSIDELVIHISAERLVTPIFCPSALTFC